MTALIDEYTNDEIVAHYRTLGYDLTAVWNMINRCKIKAKLKLNYDLDLERQAEVKKKQFIRVWKKSDGIEQAFKSSLL